MITMTLNTNAIKKALIQYLATDLNMCVGGREIDVTVIVGRKSADKPVPEVTATINIQEKPSIIANSTVSGSVQSSNDLPETSESEEDFNEEEVCMPVQTPESDLGQIESEPDLEEEEDDSVNLNNAAALSFEPEPELVPVPEKNGIFD